MNELSPAEVVEKYFLSTYAIDYFPHVKLSYSENRICHMLYVIYVPYIGCVLVHVCIVNTVVYFLFALLLN